MKPAPILGTDVYIAFKALDRHSFRSIIRFFERNQASIQSLPDEQYLELLNGYIRALFDAGEYYRFLHRVDEVIALSMDWNIRYIEGEELLTALLFKKAAAYYNLGQVRAASLLLEELLRIDPAKQDTAWFLIRCRLQVHGKPLRHARAFGILALLSAVVVIMVEILILRPFFQPYVAQTELLRNSLFLVGLLSLVLAEVLLFAVQWTRVQMLVKHNKRRKIEKQAREDDFYTAGRS